MTQAAQQKHHSAIHLQDAAYGYRKEASVFSGVSFELFPGDVLTILGANGAGKSTLLNCMAGLYPLDSGHIDIGGRRIDSYSIAGLALELAYVPQARSAVFSFTVHDYVVMGRAPHIGLMRVPSEAEYRKVDEVLAQMNISHLRDKPCSAISGGEMQQVQIARALAQEARILLMDEPTNHLDYGNQLRVLRTVAELSERGYTIVLTTHVPDHAILLGGLVAVLQPDHGFAIGPAEEIVDEENLAAIYDTDLRVVYVKEVGRRACLAANTR